MDYVFPAIEQRFNRSGGLKKYGRKLFNGSVEEIRVVRPYVELIGEDVHRDYDTFDTTQLVYSLIFRVKTRSARTEQCSRIMRLIREEYNRGNLQSAFFDTSEMVVTGEDPPKIEDGKMEGEVRVRLHVTLKQDEPKVHLGV